jgi:beta-alanine--pyruvate transaminase
LAADFAGTFQMGHPRAFECASQLVNVAPPSFNHVFLLTQARSVETALKIALAYHRAKATPRKCA